MAQLYFHLQMLADLEMKIEINPIISNFWRDKLLANTW
jgi:hypothetical protein